MNPLAAIEVAITRQDPDGERTQVLNEAERVDLPTMIDRQDSTEPATAA